MQKITFFWEFIKSTMVFNFASSVLIAFTVHLTLATLPDPPPPLYEVYIRCCMYGGSLLSLFYKEISNKNEYYFYYNRGISKLSLIVTTMMSYILIGYLLINILHYAKHA